MDIVLHGITGVIITAVVLELFGVLTLTSPILITLFIVWIIGAFPDLVGYLDGLIRGKEYRWNGWYRHSHDATGGIWKILSYIPFVWLHIKIDKFWHHDKKGGWKWWGSMVDTLIWAILIMAVILVFG